MSARSWMPLYWGDYLRDTSHLTQGQHGAYLLLIGHYWVKGKLPAMHEQCYCIARAMDEQSRSNVDAVLSEFFDLDEDCYTHKRIDAEIEKADGSREKRANAAKKRWDKNNEKINADAMHDAMHEHACALPQPQPQLITSSLRSDERPEGTLETQDEDLKARIFGPALQWLSDRSGKPVTKLRSLVGKWCSQNGDGATLEAFQQAARASPVDPISWIEERLNGGKNGKAAETKPTGSDERVEAVAARLRRLKIGTYSDGDDQPVLPSV